MKKEIKEKVIRRLKILEGQIRGIQKMVAKEEYCISILQQSSAAKQALSGIEDLILENHLSTHVIEQIKTGKEVKVAKEILEIYKLSKKK
ncbi:MAG: metal-sensing transcriptional repressor [Patescibacteria group bacterium]